MFRKMYVMPRQKKNLGQAIVEYIIIIAIVAIGALTVIGLFSDRIKQLFSGATSELGSDAAQSEAKKSSKDELQNMDETGMGD